MVLHRSITGHLAWNYVITTSAIVFALKQKITRGRNCVPVPECVRKPGLVGVEAVADGCEDVRDLVAEDRQDADNNNSDKNKDQSIFDETLAFLTGEEVAKHDATPFFNVVLERACTITE